MGGTAVALPFLPSLMGESRAASKAPKRFIFVFISNGEWLTHWFPQGPQPWKPLDANVRETPLAPGPGALSTVLGESLAPFKSKLLLLRGLDVIKWSVGGHATKLPLTGYLERGGRPKVSIDQLMAFSPAVYPTPPAIGQPRSVHMLVKTAYQAATYVSTTKDGADVPHETDVTKSWINLFGNFFDPTAPGAEIEAKRRALRLGLMDRVRADYQKLKANPRVGAEDRKTLDSHLTFLNDLNLRLRQTPAVTEGCSRPDQPAKIAQSGMDESAIPALTKINIDMLAAAIKCDRTRVATLELCPGTDLRTFSFLPGGALGQHHGVSHETKFDYGSTGARPKFARMHAWYADQVAYLLTRLNEVEDPVTGATYLDNSIVYWGNEDGCTEHDVHENKSYPVLLAGSGGGTLKTGRYVDYRSVTTVNDKDQGPRPYYNSTSRSAADIIGRPYNSLLITLMQAMGMQPSEWESGGQPGFGDYSGNLNNQYSITDGQKELPHIRA